MVKLKFDITGLDKCETRMKEIKTKALDLRKPFADIYEDFKDIEDKQFATQGSRSGGRWKPLSKKYAEWKKKNYPGQTILKREGGLVKSLVEKTKDTVLSIRKDELVMGTKVKYANNHQKGITVPQRKFLAPLKSDLSRWAVMIRQYIIDKMK